MKILTGAPPILNANQPAGKISVKVIPMTDWYKAILPMAVTTLINPADNFSKARSSKTMRQNSVV